VQRYFAEAESGSDEHDNQQAAPNQAIPAVTARPVAPDSRLNIPCLIQQLYLPLKGRGPWDSGTKDTSPPPFNAVAVPLPRGSIPLETREIWSSNGHHPSRGCKALHMVVPLSSAAQVRPTAANSSRLEYFDNATLRHAFAICIGLDSLVPSFGLLK
jgi:hypothetical protein